ncbi:helicase HerA domain-containing protein [Bradyrhizobium diazoefficiens]
MIACPASGRRRLAERSKADAGRLLFADACLHKVRLAIDHEHTGVLGERTRLFRSCVEAGRVRIGNVPSTNIGTAALDDLVQFHTTILGMTGTGKSELALDVVRQAADNDFKVFCVDFHRRIQGAPCRLEADRAVTDGSRDC